MIVSVQRKNTYPEKILSLLLAHLDKNTPKIWEKIYNYCIKLYHFGGVGILPAQDLYFWK